MSKKKNPYYPINQLCKVIDCEHKTAQYVEFSEYLVVRTNNVRNGILVLDNIKYTTKEGFIEWTQRAVPEYGDVFFTREAPAGETCLVPSGLKICMGQRMVLLRPNKDIINPHFLSFYLTSKECRREIYQYVIGSTVTRINIDDILQIKIFCPSIAEQEKIASFLGAVDTRLNQLRRKRELLQTYKRGVMQKLFSQEIRFKGAIGLPFPDWERKKLQEITKINQGLQIAISDRFTYQVEGGYFYITNEFLKPNSQTHYYILNPPKRVLCDKDDILMTRTGNTGQVVTDVVGAFHNNFFKIDYDRNKINKKFLLEFFKRDKIQYKILSLAGTSTIPDLNHDDFYNLEIFIPVLAEQKKIANFLTAIDRKIETLSRQIDQTEQFKKGLLQKLFV
ncbi:MAG: restriction endonuclease subunit S [Nostoc sp.]|uniref:restriction endonuclease subunit S n=1 Tax=Nostoc sp. TaxID=1180 RepID=UPI002FFA7D38